MRGFKLVGVLSLVVFSIVACGSPAAPPGTPTAGAPTATPQVQIVQVVATPAPTKPPRPNVLRANLAGDVSSLDPAIAQDPSSLAVIEEIFVGLVRLDETTNEPRPGIATGWTASPDGKTLAFKLRGDVPWVRFDNATKQIVKVQTCPDKNKQTKDRLVVAKDFEYALVRALKPATASPFANLLAVNIEGGAAFLAGETVDANKVAVKALDDTTLEIKWRNPIAFAPTLTSLAATVAVPRWLIDGDECNPKRGDKWTDLANLQTYGPFVLKEWARGASLTLAPNPFWVGDATTPKPTVEQVSLTVFDDAAALQKFQSGELDAVTVPATDFDRVKSDANLAKLLTTAPNLCTYYYGFNTRAKIVDDARVRRALSLAIDRKWLAEGIVRAGQQAAQWFTLPGVTGAPSLKTHPELGIKYDPTEAKKVLDDYLKEKNTTADKLDLTLTYNPSPGNQKLAEAALALWRANLGVNVKLVAQEWDALTKSVKSKSAPQIWRFGWCIEYPDAANFLDDVAIPGGSANPTDGGLNWKNAAYQALVKKAAIEKDALKRVDLYAQAEKILVNDAAALIPIYWYGRGVLTQPWINRTFAFSGRERYERWQVQP